VVLALYDLRKAGDGRLIQQVELGDVGSSARGCDLLSNLLEAGLVSSGEDDGGSHAGELFADGFADAARCSSDDG
jgi:hypothetical protein